MSFPLLSGAKDAGDGKGLGLFASRHYESGSVLFEEEALFKGNGAIPAEVEYLHFYSKLMHWYSCLLEEPLDREVVEYVLFKTPSPQMLSTMVPTRSQLEIHNPEFAELDEKTKLRNLHGLMNFYGGARLMHDVADQHSGFSVHCSLLNHSCNPNAILCTYHCTAEHTRMVGWKTGRIQIRAVRPIKAGEEITISYDQFLRGDPQFRRQFLRNVYHFDCTCQACNNETSSSRQQFISLYDASQKIWAKDTSYSHAYRTAHRFCSNAAAMGWNDRPFVDIFHYAAHLAEMHHDRLREKYFLIEAERWCRAFFGEEHERTSYLRERLDRLRSLGVPSIIGEAGPDVRPLVFMLEHPADDDRYYFLQCDKGVVSEFVESQNDPVSDLATEAARIEASRTSLLKEVEAEAEKTEKQKSKKREKKMKAKAKKKQAQHAAETSSNDQDPPQTAASQSSPDGRPTSTSTSTDVPKATTAVDREETISPPSVSEHPTSSDSQEVDSEKQSNQISEPAKGKQRAAENTADFYTYPLTPPDFTEEPSASSSPPQESLSASPPAPSKQVVSQSERRELQTAHCPRVKFLLRNPPTIPAFPKMSLLFPHASPPVPN